MLHKIYGGDEVEIEGRYSHAKCGIDVRTITGQPDPDRIPPAKSSVRTSRNAENAAVHPPNRRVLKQGRVSGSRCIALLHALQPGSASPDSH